MIRGVGFSILVLGVSAGSASHAWALPADAGRLPPAVELQDEVEPPPADDEPAVEDEGEAVEDDEVDAEEPAPDEAEGEPGADDEAEAEPAEGEGVGEDADAPVEADADPIEDAPAEGDDTAEADPEGGESGPATTAAAPADPAVTPEADTAVGAEGAAEAPATAEAKAELGATAEPAFGGTMENAGYVPGYRRWGSLGLSPYAPSVPPGLGGITPSFGAPTEEGSWRFDFNGSLTARFEVGVGTGADGGFAFHIPARNSTRAIQGSQLVGTNLRFTYANPYVEAFVRYDSDLTGKEYQSQTEPPRKKGVQEAHATFILPEFGQWILRLRVGAITDNWGGVAQWGWGTWGPLVGVKGMGYRLTGEYEINPEWEIDFAQGFNSLPKIPANFPIGGYANWLQPGTSVFVHHYHAGILYDSTYKLDAHFVQAYTPNDFVQESGAGTIEDPLRADRENRDSTWDTYVVHGHYFGEYFGQFGAAAALYDFDSASLIHDGITWAIHHTSGAGGMINKYLGDVDTGKAAAFSTQYDLSFRRAIDQDFYDPDASDLSLRLALLYGWTVETEDKVKEDFAEIFLKAELDYDLLSWFSTRLEWEMRDRMGDPLLEDDGFWSIEPTLIFRSDWASPDRIELRYKREFPEQEEEVNPTAPRDKDIFTLRASVGW